MALERQSGHSILIVQSQNGFGMAQHANFQIFQISRRFKVFCLTAQHSLVYI